MRGHGLRRLAERDPRRRVPEVPLRPWLLSGRWRVQARGQLCEGEVHVRGGLLPHERRVRPEGRLPALHRRLLHVPGNLLDRLRCGGLRGRVLHLPGGAVLPRRQARPSREGRQQVACFRLLAERGPGRDEHMPRCVSADEATVQLSLKWHAAHKEAKRSVAVLPTFGAALAAASSLALACAAVKRIRARVVSAPPADYEHLEG
mmetsp:Transcript_82430/g.260173  ORF Transcript_82430/g.260173 Transcript_82430/m.260173 type:complete len:204 (-) Transcript_82430:120-731(-)